MSYNNVWDACCQWIVTKLTLPTGQWQSSSLRSTDLLASNGRRRYRVEATVTTANQLHLPSKDAILKHRERWSVDNS